HPTRPSLNRIVFVMELPVASRPARQGSFQPLGSPVAVVTKDTVRSAEEGELILRADDQTTFDAIDTLLDTQDPLLLQPSASTPFWADRWLSFGDDSSEAVIPQIRGALLTKTLSWTVAATPDANLEAWT